MEPALSLSLSLSKARLEELLFGMLVGAVSYKVTKDNQMRQSTATFLSISKSEPPDPTRRAPLARRMRKPC